MWNFLRIFRGLQIHKLCQNGTNEKNLSYQKIFIRHHITKKNN